MIDLKAIAKDAAERVHQNGGCVPQMAFAPILFALQDALSTTPARAEAQDEGAAGEASAYRVRMISNDPAEWVLMHPEKALDFLSRKGWESQPLYAHPSPTPAADEDRVREVVEALRPFSLVSQLIDRYFPGRPDDDTFQSGAGWIDKDGGERTLTLGDFRRANKTLATLKSEGK